MQKATLCRKYFPFPSLCANFMLPEIKIELTMIRCPENFPKCIVERHLTPKKYVCTCQYPSLKTTLSAPWFCTHSATALSVTLTLLSNASKCSSISTGCMASDWRDLFMASPRWTGPWWKRKSFCSIKYL